MAMLTAAGAMAETIWVNGNKITGTTSLTTGGGSVSYNASTKVLTINNVVCNRSGSNNNGIDCKDVTSLTIKMSGTNSMTANNASSVVCGGNVTIEIVSGTTSFISTAGSQNAIGLYNCNLTLTGAGTLNLQSSNGHALQGREGTSNVTMKIANCNFTTQQNGIYNLKQLTFATRYAAPTVDRGLMKTTNIHFNAHTSSTNAHIGSVTTISAPDVITIKRPTYMTVSQLTNVDLAKSAVDITDEQVDTSQYVAYGDFVYDKTSTGEAVLVGADVVPRYSATSLTVPGFLKLNGKIMQVYIKDGAFTGMPQLTTAKVCFGARYLGWSAFSDCNKLTELTLPGSLTDIGGNVILGSNVSTIKWTTLNPSATNIATTAFRTYSTLKGKLYLPTEDAVSKATATGITTFMNSTLSKDCYDAVATPTNTSEKHYYVYTKPATDSAPGEMALVHITSGSSSQMIDIEDFNLAGYSYHSIIFGGDDRVYYCTSVAPTAFKGNTYITGVILRSARIKNIGAEAFSGCTKLQTLVIGEGMTSIGGNAFWGCGKIERLTWNAATMPNFSASPFASAATSLNEVTIGSTVTSIPNNLLAGCTAIETVNWEPANYPDFSTPTSSPFYSSRAKITAVNFKNGVVHIPAYLCHSFQFLRQPSFAASVTSIGNSAFYGSGVTTLNLGSVQTVGDFAFAFTPLKAVLLPSSLTSLGMGAFQNCTDLTTVTNNSVINQVQALTFYECTALQTFTLNEGVTSIGNRAFYNCKALEAFELPAGVESIGPNAFEECTGLTSFSSYPACEDITLGTNVFYNSTSGCTLHVNSNQFAAYNAADQWKDFFAIKGDLDGGDHNPFDVNNDDAVDVGDVNAILEAILAGNNDAKFNVNGDTAVDVGDVNAVLEYILNN